MNHTNSRNFVQYTIFSAVVNEKRPVWGTALIFAGWVEERNPTA